MPRITITMDVDDDFSDPDHAMGVTNEGYEKINAALAPYGDDIDIEAG